MAPARLADLANEGPSEFLIYSVCAPHRAVSLETFTLESPLSNFFLFPVLKDRLRKQLPGPLKRDVWMVSPGSPVPFP